jgi:prolyl-tRNA synthetase
MRMSQSFIRTLREIPTEADTPSHQLLLRAGFIRQLAAGIFSYLPLARRSLNKIEKILRQEMEAIGGQEITMPVVHPANIWKETGRWYKIDAELGRFKDRTDRDMVLAMTHEEVIADLIRKEIRSYRQLPQLLFHIQTKWRDDPRPRAGLIRVREFTMKDSYTLDANWEGLDIQYRNHYQAYFNIFRRCSLDVIAVGADVGMMGGTLAHEFMFLSPAGEDTLLLCHACGYSANRQIARFRKAALPQESLLAVKKVSTPECKTIEALANFMGVEQSQTAKAVFLVAHIQAEKAAPAFERFVFAIVRGDMEVNETKLANILKARALRPATEEEVCQVGAAPGYASPVGIDRSSSVLPYLVVVDDLIPISTNLVAGANQPGYHLKNVNYGRDFVADVIGDITTARQGDACLNCGQPLQAVRGVEVGNIFKLGTFYSQAMGCTFLDEAGQEKPVIMGSYGIGIGRLLGCIADAHHDEKGLALPVSIAPFQVHLVSLANKNPKTVASATTTTQTSDDLYNRLKTAEIEVLLDDRDESPGVKFNDADLIGMPVRLTIGERSLQQGGVELKLRTNPEKSIISLDNVVEQLQHIIQGLQTDIDRKIQHVDFPGDK